jgi:hypothetical protein
MKIKVLPPRHFCDDGVPLRVAPKSCMERWDPAGEMMHPVDRVVGLLVAYSPGRERGYIFISLYIYILVFKE